MLFGLSRFNRETVQRASGAHDSILKPYHAFRTPTIQSWFGEMRFTVPGFNPATPKCVLVTWERIQTLYGRT